MLKHSTSHSHYGTGSSSIGAGGSPLTASGGTGTRIQTPHPLTSSSHSGGGDSTATAQLVQIPQSHLQQQQQQYTTSTRTSPQHYQSQQQQQLQQIDPTRFLEGPPYSQSYNKSYLDQSFPSIHASRLYLDPSSRPLRSSTTNTLSKDLSPDRQQQQLHQSQQQQQHQQLKANGSIYLSPQPGAISGSAARHPSPTTRSSYTNLHHSTSINPISHLVLDGHTTGVGGGGGHQYQLQNPHSHAHLNLNTTATTTGTSASASNPSGGSGGTTLLHSSTLQSASYRHGVLRSLSLLSVLSLLLALNSLVFLLKIVWPLNMSGGGGGSSDSEFKLMYEITLCLAAMCLSINLCVLLITAAQYFFAVSGTPGSTSFLRRVTVIRGVAIGGFFLSIPLFLAALVLYTFTHLSFAIPALITTFLVGVSIILGGCAMVLHVVVWQQEKTIKRALQPPDISPQPTIELSTLV